MKRKEQSEEERSESGEQRKRRSCTVTAVGFHLLPSRRLLGVAAGCGDLVGDDGSGSGGATKLVARLSLVFLESTQRMVKRQGQRKKFGRNEEARKE